MIVSTSKKQKTNEMRNWIGQVRQARHLNLLERSRLPLDYRWACGRQRGTRTDGLPEPLLALFCKFLYFPFV